MIDKIARIYYDPRNPASLGGAGRLTSEKIRLNVSARKNAIEWLRGQDAYTIHRTARKRFPRRQTIVSGMNEQLQTDLIDVQKYKESNDGYRFILTAIDVFSKKAWAVPIRSKTAGNVTTALKRVFKNSSFRSCQSDKGSEYLNRTVQQFFAENEVKHFTTENNDIKASVVERFNRTLQETLHRWMTYTDSDRYIDALEDIVNAYNSRVHRSIGIAPNDVNLDNQEEIWWRLYPPVIDKQRSSLKRGQFVRISKNKLAFEKGYGGSWSGEIYRVTEVKETLPPVYEIEDMNGEKITGTFYENELQRVEKPKTYKIEKILRTKRSGNKKLFFVKWRGYPSSFNVWISEKDLV